MHYVLAFVWTFAGCIYFYRAYTGVMTTHLVTLATSEPKPATTKSRVINMLLGVWFLVMAIGHLTRT